MQMRASRVLRKLRDGETVIAHWTSLPTGRVVEIAAMLGFDCLLCCQEHVGNDWSVLEEQIRAAKIYDADVMVRVSRGPYTNYVRPLELDAAGIMVPHLMSLADAQEIVKMVRFHPLGLRPFDGGNADACYANIEYFDYIEQANQQRFVTVQIEDPEPLDELDDIAALEGIDILFFGPVDFAQAIDAPGQWNHPLITETRQRVASVARQHDKFAATIVTANTIDQALELGYRFLVMGDDVLAICQHCKEVLGEFAERGLFEPPTEDTGWMFDAM